VQDFEGQSLPVEFGTDVAVTSACGPLQTQYIFHAAVRKYKDSNSKQVHTLQSA